MLVGMGLWGTVGWGEEQEGGSQKGLGVSGDYDIFGLLGFLGKALRVHYPAVERHFLLYPLHFMSLNK